MKIGYARVSSKEQNLNTQIEYLKSKGIDETMIFVDDCSGMVPYNERKGFKQLLIKARAFDEIHVFKLDRLSRNANTLKQMMREFKEKKIKICASDVPELEGVPDEMQDMVTDIVVSILSYVSETERKFMKSRQREGIELAKKQGKFKGRRKKYSSNSPDKQGRLIYNHIVNDLKNDQAIKKTAKKYGVGTATVQRIKRELNN